MSANNSNELPTKIVSTTSTYSNTNNSNITNNSNGRIIAEESTIITATSSAAADETNVEKTSSTSTRTATETTTKSIKTNDVINGTSSSPVSPSLNDSYASEELKIIGHLKNIEKINEKRRVFLNNTICEEYTTTDEQLNTNSINKNNENDTNTGGATNGKFSYDDATNDVVYNVNEQHRQRTFQYEEQEQRKDTFSLPLIQKYATLPTSKTLRSPVSPPPKPPMLSRTRSIGSGDHGSTNSIPTSPLSPKVDVITSATITTATIAEPLTVQKIQLVENGVAGANGSTVEKPIQNDSENETLVILRQSAKEQKPQKQPRISTISNANCCETHKQISAKHYERLIEELKCPGCACPMKAPVLLCKVGHSVCEQCTRILLMCPLCKEPFTNIRSLTVEALSSKAHFRCANAAGGCTIRLQINLLAWHEKQCIYKPMKCFMGRVWGDCQWSGREAQWKEHLEIEHSNKVFNMSTIDLIWNMGVKQKPLTGYYVFQVYDEMFNFYEIYDKERVLFTMTCTSTVKEKKHHFAYEVTMIHPDNDALAITHKFPVHSEYDSDILSEGTCVSISLSDLAKFIDDEKLLHYRVRVLAVKSPRRSKLSQVNSPNQTLPIDFQQTIIDGVNVKGVPTDHIVTRRIDSQNTFADNVSTTPSSVATSTSDELETVRRAYNQKIKQMPKDGSGSESEPEMEAFITKKWGTPQLHFNRKYLKNALNDSASDGESHQNGKDGDIKAVNPQTDDKVSLSSNTSYTKKVSNSLRKSFRALKSDLIEVRPFSKKSQENKTKK